MSFIFLGLFSLHRTIAKKIQSLGGPNQGKKKLLKIVTKLRKKKQIGKKKEKKKKKRKRKDWERKEDKEGT